MKNGFVAAEDEILTAMLCTSGIVVVEERPPLDPEGFPHRRLRG
jgi:hypothetical protein